MRTIGIGIGFFGVLGIAWVATQPPGMQSGQARVVDGDTLEIEHRKIRLWGIDAPEKDQPFGAEAAQVLRNLIHEREVRCVQKDTDKYKRLVSVCFVGALELNRAMVKSGYAWDYKRYSFGEYGKDEAYAKSFKLGIWVGNPVEPEKWRHR